MGSHSFPVPKKANGKRNKLVIFYIAYLAICHIEKCNLWQVT